jgi:ligand-binding sensor domain-containing protein/signal transduction histidine kinase
VRESVLTLAARCLAAVCLIHSANALDSKAPMSRYIRDQWGTEQGYPGGPVYSIAQTADGYLWLGTQRGLVRFDGFNFHLEEGPNSTPYPAGPILGLTVDSAGSLWVRTRNPSLLCYRGGAYRTVKADGVTAMCRARNGETIFATLSEGIFTENAGKVKTLALPSSQPNFLVLSMAQTSDGIVWIGTRDAGLFQLQDGQISAAPLGTPDRKINCLLAAGEELWIGTDNGVALWNGSTGREGVAHSLEHVQALSMTTDRESNVWIGTGAGLVRVNPSGGVSTNEPGPLTREAITAVFEDRERNLWVGTAGAVRRLRDSVFVTYSGIDGLPSERIGPVFAGDDSRTWFAPADGGLYWLEEGQVHPLQVAGLNGDVVYSIAGAKDDLWLGRQRSGLTHLHASARGWASESYTQANGLAQNSVYSVYRTRDGTVWAGTLSGGVSKLKGGKFTTYTIANGLASNTIASILEDAAGTIWFATPTGLSALSKDRWQAFTVRDGLPSENINCLLEDSGGRLWMGTAAGLAYFLSGRIRRAPALPALHEQIFGLAEDRNGFLWVATSNHILRVNREHLIAKTIGDGDVREYGVADGLRGVEGIKRHRSVTADPLGRIWISTNRGLSVVDPARLSSSLAPALVHIQNISADGNAIDLGNPARVPGGRKRITIGFTGLNLTVPERVQFKFKLDGFDSGWIGPVTRREATYTNLSPRTYRFHVIACNLDGVWNGAEAVAEFEILPVFWQRWWFQLSAVLACVLAVLLLYRLRLHQLTDQMNVRFEERLGERTRIAQELHDTLLQGFLSASMQLHVVADRLPEESPAKDSLGRILQLMGRVTEEGRNAVQGLRSPRSGSLDLEQALSRIQEEFTLETKTGFRVIVDGRPRPLHPVLRDEVYRISREALVNAFLHSQAKAIEVELEYGSNQLRILVRDDGRGIDPKVLQTGRDGHWGLQGMRERAENIGARLHVWSGAMAGTEVQLSVPGKIAFEDHDSNEIFRWISRLYPRARRTVRGMNQKAGKN